MSIFAEATDQNAIKNATVYSQMVYDNGRKFIVRYYGIDADLVAKRADEAVKSIDSYRSPSRSGIHKMPDDQWSIDVTYYGLD